MANKEIIKKITYTELKSYKIHSFLASRNISMLRYYEKK